MSHSSVVQKNCPRLAVLVLIAAAALATSTHVHADGLWAGAAKVDITNRNVPVNDPLYVKALVIRNEQTTVAIVSVDAVAIQEIGSIRDPYLANVRAAIEKDLKIKPKNVTINVSHCHGIVCKDVEARTIQAVKEASKKMVPVNIGVGVGHEDRVQENRRLKMKDGTEIDIRHAYSFPPDDQIASVGPIDPQIGVLKLDKQDGKTLAVVYNFACHPIYGVPNGGNTADMTGFASQVIEDNLDEGTVALFIQGCGGDINPVMYKAVDNPRDAEPLGNRLGLSTLKALKKVKTKSDDRLTYFNETIAVPRADVAQRIVEMEAEQERLLKSLGGTFLNLKTFIPLAVKYDVAGDFPSYHAHGYLHEKMVGREALSKLDTQNRANLKRYIQNIHTMEQLSRMNTNLALLRKHQTSYLEAGKRTIDVEVVGMRIGEFVLVTFPGELTVEIGLGIKKRSPHKTTFVAGYTNGYIYYCPTAEQRKNIGNAQEDSDCILAPEWQAIFDKKVDELLKRL